MSVTFARWRDCPPAAEALIDVMKQEVIECLRDPGRYPGSPQSVRIIQTHLSVVCIAGDYAYKLKKPVKLPFVDFSTMERREHFCREEVRLNRRLCPDVYLGVMPLFAGTGGVSFRPDGGGEIVDHAVHMRRLPQDRMLNNLLPRDEVPAGELRQVAKVIAAFHSRAERGEDVNAAGDPENLQRFAMQNFLETRDLRGTVFDAGLHGVLEKRTRNDFKILLPKLRKRLKAGRVVDGHGDLHARNICMTEPPTIYDCLEFSDDFRCADVATENAFLVMDLLFHGHRELAEAFLEAYAGESGDDGQAELMPTLVRYRAMVRAKVSAIAASEPELDSGDRQDARASARRYFHLAAASAVAEQGPLIIMGCGLPATGKSFVLEALARQASWPMLGSDRLRKQLAGVPETEALPARHYEAAFSRRTYDEMLRRVGADAWETPLLLDANFRTQALRRRVVEAGRDAGLPVWVVWFRTVDEVVHERMAQRASDATAVSDADQEVYEKLKANFEPPQAEVEGFQLLEVDGGAPRDELVALILTALLKKSAPQQS